MLVIRLRRAGAKGTPFFRMVVAEHSEGRDGRFVEVLGHYNPRTTPETLVVNRERYDHWVGVGARPSDSVRTLVARMPEPAAEPADAGAGQTAAEQPAS